MSASLLNVDLTLVGDATPIGHLCQQSDGTLQLGILPYRFPDPAGYHMCIPSQVITPIPGESYRFIVDVTLNDKVTDDVVTTFPAEFSLTVDKTHTPVSAQLTIRPGMISEITRMQINWLAKSHEYQYFVTPHVDRTPPTASTQ